MKTRDEKLVAWASEGVSYREMGARLGVSVSRIVALITALRAKGVYVAHSGVVRRQLREKSRGMTYARQEAPCKVSTPPASPAPANRQSLADVFDADADAAAMIAAGYELADQNDTN